MAEAGEPAPPTLQMPSEQPDSPVSVPPVGPPPAMQLPLQPPAALQHPWGMQAAGGGMVQPGLMVGMGSQALPPQTQINPQAFLAQAPAPTGVPLQLSYGHLARCLTLRRVQAMPYTHHTRSRSFHN